jgi:hypothetical protein
LRVSPLGFSLIRFSVLGANTSRSAISVLRLQAGMVFDPQQQMLTRLRPVMIAALRVSMPVVTSDADHMPFPSLLRAD